jgi:hypothetical protein
MIKAPHSLLGAIVYAAIAALFAGAAAYMHVVQKAGLMQPQVLFPSLGAVWFGFRALFSVLPKPSTPGNS